jgi:hypothetical protein
MRSRPLLTTPPECDDPGRGGMSRSGEIAHERCTQPAFGAAYPVRSRRFGERDPPPPSHQPVRRPARLARMPLGGSIRRAEHADDLLRQFPALSITPSLVLAKATTRLPTRASAFTSRGVEASRSHARGVGASVSFRITVEPERCSRSRSSATLFSMARVSGAARDESPGEACQIAGTIRAHA